MPITEQLDEFAGKKVVDWEVGEDLRDLKECVPAVRLGYDEHEDTKRTWVEKFEAFLIAVESAEGEDLTGLVVGGWDPDMEGPDAEPVIAAIAGAAEKLPHLTAIFLGDMTYEECEISWIKQNDVTPILDAYPQLEELGVRGGDGLKLRQVSHSSLKKLVIQTGGLDKAVVQAVAKCQFPALEHLELWLGDSGYGADTDVEDLTPFFKRELFPELRTLGLKNSEYTDQIAMAIVSEPIMEQLETLDLSMGSLGDDGGRVLAGAESVKKLRVLNLNHQYCSEEVVEQLRALPIQVLLDEAEKGRDFDPDEDRFVEVSE